MNIPFHLPHGTGAHPPHRGHYLDRFTKFEGAADYFTIGAIVLFAAAMVIGLLTTTGSSPWM